MVLTLLWNMSSCAILGRMTDNRLTEIADVLAEHQKASWGMGSGTPDTCRCGARTMYEPGDEDVTIRRDRAFAAHQAKALALRYPPGGES